MGDPVVRRTTRLILRNWRASDLAPFAALNADPEVMRYFPAPLTRSESDTLAARIQESFATRGFGLWAVEIPATADFIGFVGLEVPSFDAHFTPCIEIGWRLARAHWRKGYATEAARAVLDLAFNQHQLSALVSFTATLNVPSQRVMERIGMRHDADDDFDHPGLPPGHRLHRHVLYRLSRAQWLAQPERDR